jgi:mannose-6-phosphate isomerase-like protein (cupin superfamily)
MTEVHVKAGVALPGDAELIAYPLTRIRVQAGHGDIQVADYRDADREFPPKHSHPWDEVQIVVDGEVEFVVGDADPVRGGPGTVQFLPSGTAHATRVPEGDARLIQVSMGAPYDSFARDMAAALAEHGSLERRIQVAASHGVELG